MKEHETYLSDILCTTKQECLDNASRIQASIKKVNLTTEEIIAKTCEGYSIQFAPDNKSWKQQTVYGIDIDWLHRVTVQRLLTELRKYKLRPFAVFATLGNQDITNPVRVRLYFALNQPVTNRKLMHRIILYTCYAVNSIMPESADYRSTDPGHLFFPGHLIVQSPGSKVFLKDILAPANVICADRVLLVNREHLLTEIQDSFNNGYGISGTVFSGIPDPAPWILIGIDTDTVSKTHTLRFLSFTFPPTLLHVLDNTNKLIHIESIDTLIHNIHMSRGDNRYNIYIVLGTSKAQKSLRADFSSATVNKYDFVYFLSVLVSTLAKQFFCPDLTYESIKKNEENISGLSAAFGIQSVLVTKKALIENLQEYQHIDLTPYPSLSRLISKRNRLMLLRTILQKAEHNTSMLHSRTVSYKCQYAIPIQQLQKETGISRSNISELVTLFHTLGLVKRIEKDHVILQTRKKESSSDLPMVLEIPWYDNYLLAKAERKAKQFLKQDQTIRGARKTDTNSDTYLAIKNCVISLLENRGFFTRADLVRLIESEAITNNGAKGDYLANRYLPSIASDMELVKQNFAKRLEPLFPDTSGLTYGTSILYFRKELLHATDYKTTA